MMGRPVLPGRWSSAGVIMARLWSAAFVLGAMASGAVAQNLVSHLNLLQAQAARSNPLQSFAVVGDYGSSGQGSATIPTTTDPQQIAAAQTAAQVVAQASAGVAARL